MPVTLKVYANEDDALLYWSVASPVPQCRGFAIERKLTDAHGVASDTFLPNRIGFAGVAPSWRSMVVTCPR